MPTTIRVACSQESGFFSFLCALGGSFAQVLGKGEQAELYGDFLFATQQEAVKLLVAFDVAEDRLYITTSLLSLFYTFFGVEFFPGNGFVTVQVFVYFYGAVAVVLVAYAT